ncbi:hypothetical protein [uncultured Sphingomonas sp.]|uniref:hypothetical protein n=1 Tax=uncultured Sphingomonas sp. TaxID=158754 RepID=UPI0025FFB02A|nr:hypothetical protein [uncultured Sphingomonas sp.]
MKKAFYTALAAFSLVTAPTIAAAAPIATPLTQPATETVDGENALAGGAGFIVLALAIVAIGLGVYVAVDSAGDDALPTSP